MVAANGLRSMGWPAHALLRCAVVLAAGALTPAAFASGLVPDPDPSSGPVQPQPDPYQASPTAVEDASAAPAPAPVAAPALPAARVSTPPKVQVQPAVVASPAHVSAAVTEAPASPAHVSPAVTEAPRSTPSSTGTHIVIPAVAAPRPKAAEHPRRTPVGRDARQTPHHAHAAPPADVLWFARSALELRWAPGFAPSVELTRPHRVPPGVALAVAAVVLLSGSFLAVAARHVRHEVGP